jgi:hypothetical protein
VSEDAGTEPRTVATSAWLSDSARSHPSKKCHKTQIIQKVMEKVPVKQKKVKARESYLQLISSEDLDTFVND